MIVGMAREAVHANTLIEKLRSELAALPRLKCSRLFGRCLI